MRICASQGAEEVWSVKVGAIAKTAEGKLGVVTYDPDGDGEVRLRFADGETSGYIKADSLTQATPSDAGYEAILSVALDKQLADAADKGDAAAIERLAGEGASPDAKDEYGNAAVWLAAAYGHTAAVEALLRLGADPNATNSRGATALTMAALNGQAECARLLLEAGADATLRATGGRWEGQTALELAEERAKQGRYESDEMFAARQKSYAEVVALLVERLSPAEKAQWERRKAEWERGKAEVAALLRG